LVKKARSDNARKFHEMVSEKIYSTGKINDLDYFKKKLSNKEQLRAMSDLKEINEHIYLDKPYRMAILEMDISYKHKAVALSRLDAMKQMELSSESSGYTKMKEWLDTFMRIPFGRYRDLPVKFADGHDKCFEFMHRAKQTLDECTYGMNDAKMQIMQVLGNWISNPSSTGTAIAIKGPAGTGKTTLCRDGISKILGREFAFITLGGATDSAFLDGFSYTYEGAKWGKIVQILIDSKSMNPVIYFDELDKISTTERGQEISGILTHLTDTSQNNQFHDKYFSEIDFDLSRCLFIFSYNEEALVNPILRDRMYIVETKGYSNKEKVIIAQKYMLPKILQQVFFRPDEVIIPDETIQYMLEKPDFIVKEEGVRNLKRALEIIVKKLNLLRLMTTTPPPSVVDGVSEKKTTDIQLFGEEFKFEIKFPMTIGKEHVDALIKKKESTTRAWDSMFV
jgi:ATP-dependent Lon protease